MTTPQKTLDSIIYGYEQQGYNDDQIQDALVRRGIVIDDLDDNAGEQKFPITIGEYIDSGPDEGLAVDLYQRGILNIRTLRDEQFDLPLPPMRQNLNETDELLIKDHVQNLAAGKYDDWQWDPELKAEQKAKDASRAILRSQAPSANMDLIDQYVEASLANYQLDKVETTRGRGATTGFERSLNQSLAGQRSPLPTLGNKEKEIADRLVDARKALDGYGASAGVTGGTIGVITGLADLMGIRPAAEDDEGIFSYLSDKTARGLATALLNQPSDLDKQRKLKDTPQYKSLMESTLRRRREAMNELADITGRDEGFDDNYATLQQTFGKIDKTGKVLEKGYFRPTNEVQKKLLKDIQNTMRVEERLNSENTYKDFTTWLDTALKGTGFEIDHETKARESRQALVTEQEQRLKASPRLHQRIGAELSDIAQGLYALTSVIANPSKTAQIDNLADLVAAGKIDQDEAKLLMDQKGFQSGAALFGGFAGWLGGFTDLESFKRQAKNEPVGTILAFIPVMKAFQVAKVAGATRGLNRLKKMAEKAGFSDSQILEIANRADDIMTKQQRGMLENWLDTARGKYADSKFLEVIDRYGIAQGTVGAVQGAALGFPLGGEGDVFIAGLMGGVGKGVKGAFRGSARSRRFFDDIAATTTPGGDAVTNNTSEMLARAQSAKSALEVALDDARRSGRSLDREDLERAIDADGAAEKVAELYWHADASVSDLKARYKALPLGSPEKAEARRVYLTAQNTAMNEFIERGDFGGMIPVTRNDATLNLIYDDFNLRKEGLEKDRQRVINNFEEKRRKEAQRFENKNNASAIKEAEKEMLTARGSVTRAQSDVATLREAADKRYNNDLDTISSQVLDRRKQRAKGTKLTRTEEFLEAESAPTRIEGQLELARMDADELFRQAQNEGIVKPGQTIESFAKGNRNNPVVKAYRKTKQLEKDLEKARKRQAKAKAEFEDPKVQYTLSASTGKLVKGKSRSYPSLVAEIEQRRIKDELKISAAETRVAEAKLELETSKETMAQIELKASREISDTDIERLSAEENFDRKLVESRDRQLAELDEAEKNVGDVIRLIADTNMRAKKGEYYKAIKATFGYHVDDGNYVLAIDAPVLYQRDIKLPDGEIVRGTRKVTPLVPSDFDLNDYTRMPNGYLGTARALDTSTGNLLAQIQNFPAKDVPRVVAALNKVVNQNFETIAGARLADSRFDLEKIRKDLRKWDGKKPLKATPENESWTRGLIDAMGASIEPRGINDLKRIQLSVYGDLIVNQANPRLLLNTDTRSRFVSYALKTIHPQLEKAYGKATTKGQRNLEIRELEQELTNMVRDFAQTRSLGGDTTLGRGNYKFSRQVEVPNPDDPNVPLRKIESLEYDGPRGRKELDIENLFEDFAESELTAPQIARARQHAIRDTLYYTQRGMEGRIAVEEATLIASGVSREVWDKGGKSPEYIQGVYKKFLETGEMPAALKLAETKEGYILSANQNAVSRQILNDLVDNPEFNKKGMSTDEAAALIDQQLRTTADPKADRGQDYVRLGSDGAPDIPGVNRIGQRPVAEQGVGLTSTHNILQPEHLDDITTQIREGLEGPDSTTTIFMRRDVADSFGWMLGTNKTLQAMDSGNLAQLQVISTLFKWFKTAGSIVNPMTNYASNTKTLLINQGLNPVQAYLAPVETAALWSRYSAGLLKGTSLEKRFDRLVETGFTEQSVLGAEIDSMNLSLTSTGTNVTFAQSVEDLFKKGVVPGTGGKKVPGVQELTELQDRLYRRYGDELFKLTDSMIEWGKIEDRINNLSNSSGITFTDLNTGAGFSNSKVLGTIRKISDDDGNKYAVVMKYGKNRNKVIRVKSLDDPAAGNLIARAAMGHANSLYYDLSKTGSGIKMAKRLEALAIMPFTSWRTKALDIPMVKKGMFYRMFVDDNYMMSDDIRVNFAIYGEEAKRAMRRSFWTAVGKSGSEDYREIRPFMKPYAQRGIFTGSDADISFLLADSSNPIGGLMTAIEWMAESDQLIRDSLPEGTIANPTAGDRAFFRMIHGNASSGVAPTISKVVADLTGGGVLQQVVAAFAGYDTLRDRPIDSYDDYLLNLTRTIMPGYAVKLGLPTVATFGALPTDNYVKQFLDQTRSNVPFNIENMGRSPSQKILNNGDNFVTGINVLLARKFRRVDPFWFKNLAVNMVPRLKDMALRTSKELIKEGYGPETEKFQRNAKMIQDVIASYQRYAKTIGKALKARD
tara:strand:- start:1768 stop:8427 length:6660 start_codon:yes stop_codon:yes gene_type:complete